MDGRESSNAGSAKGAIDPLKSSGCTKFPEMYLFCNRRPTNEKRHARPFLCNEHMHRICKNVLWHCILPCALPGVHQTLLDFKNICRLRIVQLQTSQKSREGSERVSNLTEEMPKMADVRRDLSTRLPFSGNGAFESLSESTSFGSSRSASYVVPFRRRAFQQIAVLLSSL